MTTSEPIDPPVPDGARTRRRVPWWAVAAPLVMVVGVVALVVAAPGGSDEPAGAAPAPRFVDDTSVSGIDHSYTGGFDH
ncbi:MAG: hypothetical protein WBL31_17705, partial [Ilumatobacteraceae bacterium]